MAIYKRIRELWKQPKKNLGKIYTDRLIQWRKETATLRIKKPTRLDRARSLGYRAKPGFIIIRQRVLRGGHIRPNIVGGRRSKHSASRKNLNMNYQWIAEIRAQKMYVNCEVLNSYFVAKDGMHYWYEVILVDRANPNIINDKRINWICLQRGRANRGLTAAGKQSKIKI
jgi:large subunit ribosomal protein L15e